MATRTSKTTKQTTKNAAGWILALVLLVLAPLLVTACDDGITIPDMEPSQEGMVFALNSDPFAPDGPQIPVDWTVPDTVESVWVKESPDAPCGVVWTLRPGTQLLVQEGSALRRAVPADFRPQRDVRVWTDGAIATSCPGQGSPTTILLR